MRLLRNIKNRFINNVNKNNSIRNKKLKENNNY